MRITNLKPRNKYIPRRVGLTWCVDILRMRIALLILFNNTWIFPYSWELRLVPRYSYNIYLCFPRGSTPHISPLSRVVYPIYPCLPALSFFLTNPFPMVYLPQRMPVQADGVKYNVGTYHWNYFFLLCFLFRIIGKDTLNIKLTLFKAREFNKKAKRRTEPRKSRKAHDWLTPSCKTQRTFPVLGKSRAKNS